MTETTKLVRTVQELHAQLEVALGAFDPSARSVGLVPTMGALHPGHRALAGAAVEHNSVSVASIFVNPLQFGDAVDLDRYPRTLEADLHVLSAAGVDLAFAPELDQMYPDGEPMVRISAGTMGNTLEGVSRPGHFDGALTVVAKLLHLVQPRVESGYRAYFGEKDAQQLALVRKMAADLNFPVEIVGVPTVRDDDGLARSSRNKFLDAEHRQAALVLPRALRMLSDAAAARRPLPLDEAQALIASAPLVELDYLEVVDPATLLVRGENCANTPFTGTALAVIAARVGPVRLIDNCRLGCD